MTTSAHALRGHCILTLCVLQHAERALVRSHAERGTELFHPRHLKQIRRLRP